MRNMAQNSVSAICKLESGAFICTYEYDETDKVSIQEQEYSVNKGHPFHAICWKGNGQTMNVMCNKVELENIKHKFSALGILRPKISPPSIPASAPASAPVAATPISPSNTDKDAVNV